MSPSWTNLCIVSQILRYSIRCRIEHVIFYKKIFRFPAIYSIVYKPIIYSLKTLVAISSVATCYICRTYCHLFNEIGH